MRLSIALYPIFLLLTLLLTQNTVLADTSDDTDKRALKHEVILIWGDSIGAGFGVSVEQGWAKLLEQKINTLADKPVTVINGSISGETTQGGLTRLPAALETHKPDLLILELGGNDGLRGIAPKKMKQNLLAMIELAKQQTIEVVLLGMKIPTNYGAAYSKRFEASFAEVAEEQALPFHPFFMQDIALNPDYMQEDAIHPNTAGQPFLMEQVWTVLESVVLADK